MTIQTPSPQKPTAKRANLCTELDFVAIDLFPPSAEIG